MDPAADPIFSCIWPLDTDEEWNRLENELFQNGIRVPYLHPLELDDGVEGSWLDPPLPDQPGGDRDRISVQIHHKPDHPGENNVSPFKTQTVGENSLGPDYSGVNSIFSSCLPLFTDEEWNRLENEFYQNGTQASCLHPLRLDDGVEGSGLHPSAPDELQGVDHISGLIPQEPDHPGENEVSQFIIPTVGTNSLGLEHPGPDSVVETEVRDGVEGSGLYPSMPDQQGANVDHISGQISQEPDHPGENEVGQSRVQADGTDSRGPEYPGKDGEGGTFNQMPEHAPPGLATEASSNLRKQCGRHPKHPELAPVVPISPRRGHGRPRKCPELASDVPGAAANPENLPTQQSTQQSRRPKETRGLPEGWITTVEVRKGGHSAGHKDKTYIELSTNKRCRSIPDVWRYIEKKSKLE